MSTTKPSSNLLIALMIVSSGLLWVCFSTFNKEVFSATNFGTGIELVYLPAGFRLVIVLIFGVWGAIGIAISNLFLVHINIGEQSALATVTNSAIAGFVPFLSVRAVQRWLGIDHNLSSLKPIHLPIFALVVSITAPLAFTIQFVSIGVTTYSDMAQSLSAMILGDFLGCLVALAILRAIIALFKTVEP